MALPRGSLFFFLILITSSSIFTGKVIYISDGDTITVLTKQKKQIKIRLEGIDCPEKNQAFGTKAKQAISELCKKNVIIRKSSTDRYGRTIGFVYVDEINVNKELIKLGLAWHYKYFNKDKELAQLEEKARNQQIGIWSEPNPIPP